MKNRTERDSFKDRTHILIAGDDSDVVANLQNLLEQHDYEVPTASKGSDAARQILEAAPDTFVLEPQVSAQQIDGAHEVTENSQEHAGEGSPPEIPLTRESLDGDYASIIGESTALFEVLHRVEMFATSPIAVLASGETGTGKELVAQALHGQSNRSEKKIVVANCAEFSEALIASELFGHERGRLRTRTGNISAYLKRQIVVRCSLMKSGNSPYPSNRSCYGYLRKAKSDASGG